MSQVETYRPPQSEESFEEDIVHLICDKAKPGDWVISLCGNYIGIYKDEEDAEYECGTCLEMADLGLCTGSSICDCENGIEI